MYEKFYGFNEAPFQLTPDPRFLYMSSCHREAYAQLLIGLQMRKGFIVLSGEVGTGKTTLIRKLVEEVDLNVRLGLIFHTLLSAKGLLQNICKEFGLETQGFTSKTDYVMALHDFLKETHASGGTAVLIIDEAHNLKEDVLEEVRLLSNFETSQQKLLQICLVGQPELIEKLSRPELRQLSQRISLRFSLSNLSEAETAEYIRYRLNVAGMNIIGELFTPAATAEVYRLTGGVPREINILCENALVLGYVKGCMEIDANIVQAANSDDAFNELENAVAANQTLAWKQELSGSREAAGLKDSPGHLGNSGFVAAPAGARADSMRSPENPDENGKQPRDHAAEYDSMPQVQQDTADTWDRSAEDLAVAQPEQQNGTNAPANSRRSDAVHPEAAIAPASRPLSGESEEELIERVFERVVGRLKNYYIVRKRKTSTVVAMILIAILTYALGILGAILLLKNAGLF